MSVPHALSPCRQAGRAADACGPAEPVWGGAQGGGGAAGHLPHHPQARVQVGSLGRGRVCTAVRKGWLHQQGGICPNPQARVQARQGVPRPFPAAEWLAQRPPVLEWDVQIRPACRLAHTHAQPASAHHPPPPTPAHPCPPLPAPTGGTASSAGRGGSCRRSTARWMNWRRGRCCSRTNTCWGRGRRRQRRPAPPPAALPLARPRVCWGIFWPAAAYGSLSQGWPRLSMLCIRFVAVQPLPALAASAPPPACLPGHGHGAAGHNRSGSHLRMLLTSARVPCSPPRSR